MKKLLSNLLVLCMLFSCFSTVAFATEDEGGFTGGSVADNMGDDDFNQYTVAFNDFSSTNKTDFNKFKIIDSAEAKYGKVFEATDFADDYSNCIGSGGQGTYIWNGKTYNTFNETLATGEKYILSYDFKCLTLTNLKPDGNALSAAPQYEAFWNGSDYRNYIPHTTDLQWHNKSIAFYAEKDTIDMKFLLCQNGVRTFIDNYCIQEAASISLADGAVLELVSGYTTTPVGATTNEIWALKGTTVKFKVNLTGGTIIDTVSMGSSILTPDKNGVYTAAIVTDDIVVTTKPDLTPITNNYAISGSDIYIPYQDTVYDIVSLTGMDVSALKVTTSEDVKKYNDQYLVEGDKLSVIVNGETAAEYTIKTTGNAYAQDEVINVTDITTVLDAAINTPTGMPITYDIDGNGIITVTDAIRIRNKVLNVHENETPATSAISKNNTYTTNTLNSVTGFVPTTDNLEAGIYNRGNRALLVKAMERALNGETITIAGLGGSITQGSGGTKKPQNGEYKDKDGNVIGNYSLSTDLPNACYIDNVCNWWKDMFGSVKKHNMGIGSTGSALGFYRLEDDVLVNNPDIVIVDYSVNDNNPLREWNKAHYENIVRSLLQRDIAVILIGFCTNSGTLDATCEEWHKPIADYYGVPFVSYRDAYAGISLFNELSNDGTHPNIAGHALSALLINNLLGETYENLNVLSTVKSKLPKKPLNPETFYDNGGYIANLSDIEDGKYKDIEMVERGSFVRSTALKVYGTTSVNPNFRAYYGYVAKPASSYKPMILKVKNAKTALLLLQRWNTSLNSQFTVKINGTAIDDTLFNTKDSHDHHWNSNRMFYYENGKDVTIEILPTVIDYGKVGKQSEDNSIIIYSLLLAHAE